MIRNETAQNGVIIYADIIDTTTSTVSREENGVIVSTRSFTAEEVGHLVNVYLA
jgi:hypothetical protein